MDITKDMLYAPIVVFAFNREAPVRSLIKSLLTNVESVYSDLFVFVDGPRPMREGEEDKVNSVRNYVKSINGFRSVNYYFSDVNKGLGTSIIAGVSQVIDQYGSAIVLEDDLIVSSNFLSYMNQSLQKYKEEEKVFSISGYSNKVDPPKGETSDSFFFSRNNSWGWATWKDRWDSVDWDLADFEQCKHKSRDFCKWGGSDLWKMLDDWHNGVNKSWSIRFCYSQFLQDKLTLFPYVSKVSNRGFDGSGENCKTWSRFRYLFDSSTNKVFTYPESIVVLPEVYRQSIHYHSIPMRLLSRIMYLLTK